MKQSVGEFRHALLVAPFRTSCQFSLLIAITFFAITFFLGLTQTIAQPAMLFSIQSMESGAILIILTIEIFAGSLALGCCLGYPIIILLFWPQHKILTSLNLQNIGWYTVIGITTGLILCLILLFTGVPRLPHTKYLPPIQPLPIILVPIILVITAIGGRNFYLVATKGRAHNAEMERNRCAVLP